MTDQREQIPFDVLFVGGGPANLSGAIHLMALAKEKGMELEVALIEKGAEIKKVVFVGGSDESKDLIKISRKPSIIKNEHTTTVITLTKKPICK